MSSGRAEHTQLFPESFLCCLVLFAYLITVWILLLPTGLSKASPPPENELPDAPPRGPPRFQPEGERYSVDFLSECFLGGVTDASTSR